MERHHFLDPVVNELTGSWDEQNDHIPSIEQVQGFL